MQFVLLYVYGLKEVSAMVITVDEEDDDENGSGALGLGFFFSFIFFFLVFLEFWEYLCLIINVNFVCRSLFEGWDWLWDLVVEIFCIFEFT